MKNNCKILMILLGASFFSTAEINAKGTNQPVLRNAAVTCAASGNISITTSGINWDRTADNMINCLKKYPVCKEGKMDEAGLRKMTQDCGKKITLTAIPGITKAYITQDKSHELYSCIKGFKLCKQE